MLKTPSLVALSGAMLSAILACSNPTAPDFSIKFGPPELNSQSEMADITTRTGEIVITGKVTVPDPCYSGAARLEESGTTLTLHVTAGTHASGGCVTAIAYLPYTATIPATGTHEVVVIHETVGLSSPPREIARVRVTVG